MTAQIHLVGSLGLADAETAFRSLAEHLGTLAPRYPDGESGVHSNWVSWQARVFADHPMFEAAEVGARGTRLFRIRPDTAALDFPPIGYASEALQSYSIFERLKSAGTIPPGIRFQVSLPTPVAVISTFVVATDRARVEAPYAAAMNREVGAILDTIPHAELAIQWDIAIEVIAYAGALRLHYEDVFEGTVDRVTDLLANVPDSVDVGIHLCYGDPGHRHIVEPTDLGNCLEFANALCAQAHRTLKYVHVPVPRDRDDESYFEPLTGLDVGSTRLVLGLVHHTDGAAGTRRRMATANHFIDSYDIATECGFGRRPQHTITELLDIHRTVLDA